MRKHLAIFHSDAIKQILAGKKTVESRFSQKRIPPYRVVSRDDIVYIKPPGKEIVGQFRVKKAIFLEGIDEDGWNLIKREFLKGLGFVSKQGEEEYFKQRQQANFATIIFIKNIEQFITPPLKITKKDLRGWMVLN